MCVATAHTACGIVTDTSFFPEMSSLDSCNSSYRLRYCNYFLDYIRFQKIRLHVATAHTACGIVTNMFLLRIYTKYLGRCNSSYRLRYCNSQKSTSEYIIPRCNSSYRLRYCNETFRASFMYIYSCCNSSYRLRYCNPFLNPSKSKFFISCNSSYRLRYCNPKFFLLLI